MKRKLVLGSVVTLVFALGLVAASAKANFSGTWILDKSKSEGLPAALKDQTLTVVQTDDKISVEAKLVLEDGDQNVSDHFIVDGKTVDFTPKGPNGMEGKGKRTAKWSADGNSIDVSENSTFETPSGPVDVQVTRKWTLSADGKTLRIDRTVISPMGTQQINSVFVKK